MIPLKPTPPAPFVSSNMTHPARARFQFSAPTAQRAEALINLREAKALMEPRVPAHLRSEAPSTESGKAGGCFRRVTQILARKTVG